MHCSSRERTTSVTKKALPPVRSHSRSARSLPTTSPVAPNELLDMPGQAADVEPLRVGPGQGLTQRRQRALVAPGIGAWPSRWRSAHHRRVRPIAAPDVAAAPASTDRPSAGHRPAPAAAQPPPPSGVGSARPPTAPTGRRRRRSSGAPSAGPVSRSIRSLAAAGCASSSAARMRDQGHSAGAPSSCEQLPLTTRNPRPSPWPTARATTGICRCPVRRSASRWRRRRTRPW